jgi:uncharacterized damage-inducible protein DinB
MPPLYNKDSKMKKVFISFVKHNEEANRAILAIADKLSNDEREKDRGSYYGSLSRLVRHVLGGTVFLGGMLKSAVPGNAEAQQALSPLEGLTVDYEGALSEAQWKDLSACFAAADKALIDFVSALGDKDFEAPVKLEWYGGNPASVPLYFMLQQITSHHIHHRGQISQVLDELKIDNDYSGINVQFLG